MYQLGTLPFPTQVPTELRTASIEVINHCLGVVGDRYGTNGIEPREYHGPLHTLKVVRSAAFLGAEAVANGNIYPEDAYALGMSAAGHDLVYDIGRSGQNELRSATETGALVQEFFAPRPHLNADTMADRVSRLILTTQTDATITQQADRSDYASLLLCDADHSSMGMGFGTYLDDAVKLFVEANKDVIDHDERVQKLLEFLRFNISLLGDRTFFTEEAKKRFGKQRRENARTLDRFVNNQSLEIILKAIKI